MSEVEGFAQQDLPEQVQDLVTLVGYEPALLIVKHFGGGVLRVPLRFKPQSFLVRLVGHKAATAIIARHAGATMYIARCSRALRIARDIRIAAQYPAVPVPQLAKTNGLSERQIWNILKAPHTLRGVNETPQQDLFSESFQSP